MNFKLIFPVAILQILVMACHGEAVESPNNRPIIGIMAQECISMDKLFPEKIYNSYIAASYVKFFESAGARVVVIHIGREQSYYDNLISSINGIVLPGGATYFTEPNGYAQSVEMFYHQAKLNNVPIFAICLGFELVVYLEQKSHDRVDYDGRTVDHLSNGNNNYRINCSASDISLCLEFDEGFRESKLFGKLPADVERILSRENSTANYHKFCVTPEILTQCGMTRDKWQTLAFSRDKHHIQFIAAYESRTHPIYAVQFHPEKNAFEWKRTKNISHTYNAIKAARYFADFFVNVTRQNTQTFASDASEREHLIYNYATTYTGKLNSSYEECYFFK